MAASETLQKIKDMVLYAEDVCLPQFPREHRYTTAAYIRQNMDELERLCIAAWKKIYKKTTLQDMDITLQQLKNRVERCYMMHILPPKKYEQWSERLNEIGRMIGGMIKAANDKARERGGTDMQSDMQNARASPQ